MASYLAGAVRTGWRIAREERIQVVSTQDPFLTGLVGYLIARRFGLPLSLQFVADAVDNPLWLERVISGEYRNWISKNYGERK